MSQRVRQAFAAAERVVVKVGSSSLTTADGGIDNERVDELAALVAGELRGGREIVLVSSGAIASGIGPLGLARRPRDLATQQAAASVGQGLLWAHYAERFARSGIIAGQVLLTADDIGRRAHYRNAQRTLNRLLDLGALPIVNENDTVATDEIRFGDNDRLAALVAHLVHAKGLLLLSDVDGLYDGPPSRPSARRVEQVRGPDDLAQLDIGGSASHVGSGGMRTKVDAAAIATDAGIPVVLTSAALAARAMNGESVGTVFHPTRRRMPTRLLWLAHASETRGVLRLDAGAVAAVVERKASLLPAGVLAVSGDFEAGDPVDLAGPDGAVIARGLVNYDAAELPALLGRSTRDLARELGSGYERELVHRNDLVVLRP